MTFVVRFPIYAISWAVCFVIFPEVRSHLRSMVDLGACVLLEIVMILSFGEILSIPVLARNLHDFSCCWKASRFLFSLELVRSSFR